MLTPAIPSSAVVTVCVGFGVAIWIAKRWDEGEDELQPKARAEHTKKQQAMQKARPKVWTKKLAAMMRLGEIERVRRRK